MRKIFHMSILIIFLVSCNPSMPSTDNLTITPQPTYTNIPTTTPYPTHTPYPTRPPVTESWYHYQIVYSIVLDDYRGLTKVWMPVPVDGITQKGINLVEVSPTPQDIFFEAKGNRILFWHPQITENDFKLSEKFDVYILKKMWMIKSSEVGQYNPNDPVLIQYLKPSTMVQSDNQYLVQTAQEITGNEDNPYEKVKLIINFMRTQLDSGGAYEDALSVIRTKKLKECGSAAFTFVALSRAVGVPARVVTGISGLQPGVFNWKERNFGTHMWVEAYLPTYGWIPIDPMDQSLKIGESRGDRLILSRDSDINLGYGRGEIPWFHMPHVNTRQEENSDIVLDVELIEIVEVPPF